MNPLVSIITPAYNAGGLSGFFLPVCLRARLR